PPSSLLPYTTLFRSPSYFLLLTFAAFQLVTLLSIAFHSSALSWSFSAAMFSSRCASDDVPGIGNMTGDFCSNHASASCTTLTLWRFASASNGLLALLNERVPPPPIGAHGMNPIFSFWQ